MSTFNTIHIFGFGLVQVIGKDFNHQVKISQVQNEANACIDNVWAQVPSPPITNQYHAINIFNGMFADWQSKVKGEKGFRTKYDLLDSTLFDALAEAVIQIANP